MAMGRAAVVTAGTAGIGLATAMGLAAAGFEVTVVGRDQNRGAEAVERIKAVKGKARFLQVDLALLPEVRGLANRLAEEGELVVLVNNVGAMFPHRKDIGGVEASFLVNHLSPYLLTELLVPMLKANGPSRVVNVTSGAVGLAKKRFEEVEPPGGYYGFHWYGRAKLANLAYTLDLAKRLAGTGVTVLAADPGGAATAMTNGTMGDPKIVAPGLRVLWPLVRRKFERSTRGSASTAARSSIVAATDGTLESGTVVGPAGRPVKAVRAATDPRVVEAVRRLSRAAASQHSDGVSE
jgi:NAD(P)-dependent dehydrogenase (short-subunit alcohol dehydrogenase family)